MEISAMFWGIVLSCLSLIAGCKQENTTVPVNEAPVITSPGSLVIEKGEYFVYHISYLDTDGPDTAIAFMNLPSWLVAGGDSVFGDAPAGMADTSFIAIVTDGTAADTLDIVLSGSPVLMVYGDTRSGHSYHQQIVDLMEPYKPVAVFHTGDLVNDGTVADEWTIFNNITSELRNMTEFYPVLGNHEKQSQLFFDQFVLPNNEQWYSVEKNSIHFIALNSCVDNAPGSEQYQWLVNDLEAIADSVKFIVAYFHHPPYSTGLHTEDEKDLRESWVPLFEQYGVDIVFNGHDHFYERSFCGGIYYVVAGGGGAPLYDQGRTDPCSQLYLKTYHYVKLSIIENSLQVRVFDINNQPVDQFAID